jgi:hypothetical protein
MVKVYTVRDLRAKIEQIYGAHGDRIYYSRTIRPTDVPIDLEYRIVVSPALC